MMKILETEAPVAEERDAIAAGLYAFERGKYAALDQWRYEMGLA